MLDVQDITYAPPKVSKPLLKNVKFTLPKNSCTAILGLNGSGKTTLLKILSGFLTPNSGKVYIEDSYIKDLKQKTLARKLSVVPQDFPTDFPYTVEDFIGMGTFPWNSSEKETIDQVEKSLGELEIKGFRKRFLSELSGGEKQRVLLARTFAQKTSLILMDEPLNHLDIKARKRFFAIVKKWKDQGKTLLAVLHRLEDIDECFTHVLLLKDGEIIACDEKKNVLTNDNLKKCFDCEEF